MTGSRPNFETIRKSQVIRIVLRPLKNATDRINKGFSDFDRFRTVPKTELFLP